MNFIKLYWTCLLKMRVTFSVIYSSGLDIIWRLLDRVAPMFGSYSRRLAAKIVAVYILCFWVGFSYLRTLLTNFDKSRSE